MEKNKDLKPEVFQRLAKKNSLAWIRDGVLDWTVIVATMYVAISLGNVVGYAVAVLIIGNRQHALAILGHDGTHYTVTKSKLANDIMTNVLVFWPLGLTVSGYRNLHFRHHKYTNTANDPELMHRSSKFPQWDLPVTPKKVLKYALWDMGGYSISDYLMIIACAKPDKKSSYVWMGIYHVLFIGVFCMVGMKHVPIIWYWSLVTAFMMYFRLRTWLEHQGSYSTHRIHLTLVERVLLSPHNAWYHYEHHAWPSISYVNLPQLRALMKEEPVISLRYLIKSYKSIPYIRSGTSLKAESDPLDDMKKAVQTLAA